MRRPGLFEIGSSGINEILGEASQVVGTGAPPEWLKLTNMKSVAAILHNHTQTDILKLRLACSRLGMSPVEYRLHEYFPMSQNEILAEVSSISSVVNLLTTSIVDKETFGNGRDLSLLMGDMSGVPVIGLRDEIYAHQSALSELLAIKSKLGALQGTKIAVSWGFGNKFVPPSTAQSLVVLSALLGADVSIVAPKKFPLLRRLRREVKHMDQDRVGQIEETDEFDTAFTDAHVVFAQNWCRMDDYLHPERNADHAAEFSDWYFTHETIPNGKLFLTEPPVQQDLMASIRLLGSDRNLSYSHYERSVAIMMTTMKYVFQQFQNENRLSLL